MVTNISQEFLAEMEIAVRTEEFISHEHTNPKMLEAVDNPKQKIKMPEQKVVDTRVWTGMG